MDTTIQSRVINARQDSVREDVGCSLELISNDRECGLIALGVDKELVFEAFATDWSRGEFGQIHIVFSKDAERTVECAGRWFI